MFSASRRQVLQASSRSVRSLHVSASRSNTLTCSVNGQETEIPAGSTVLQACESVGVNVPRFCFHDRLSIAGNCRMCLVEVEKSPKPVASCAMPAMPGMKIFTETVLVKKAREGVMEFLLANHPLDCPICDQGGECDLQDQSFAFGSGHGRFRELKRSVEDKNLGPLVKTVMTRCIHCTRCIRFSTEVAGVTDLGATGRGNSMEIGTYVQQVLDSEMSGNVIDLCPVGALTSKPGAFTARPWELEHNESIDCLDAVGTNIRIDSRGTEILRIIPRLHEDINEEWMADKGRFSYDGLKSQRLDQPMMRVGDEFQPVTWKEALMEVAANMDKCKGEEMMGVVGDFVDAESMICLKDLLNKKGCVNTINSQVEAPLDADVRSNYLFNSTIQGIEDADACLLIGTNPRMEAPLVNARIRKSAMHYGLPIASVGPASNLTYDKDELGDNTSVLQSIVDGKNDFCKVLEEAERPMIVIGMSALENGIRGSVDKAVSDLVKKYPNLKAEDWDGINYLHTAAGRVASLDLGFVAGPKDAAPTKFVYLLGADSEKVNAMIPNDAFVVYQGSHGDIGATRANVIFPGNTYTEKNGIYVNLEGRAQETAKAANTIGDARDDWSILRALSEVVGTPLPYNSMWECRARVEEVAPHMANLGVIEPCTFNAAPTSSGTATGSMSPWFTNYWMTDCISRSSKVMAKCAKSLPTATNSYL